jgi:hypothetical protein
MSPRVKTITETPRRLEPVTADPFIDGLDSPLTGPARPRAEKPRPVPAPRLRPAVR